MSRGAHAERDSGGLRAASDMAGYSSAANFATAFKRRFGITPRALPGCR